MLRPLYRTILNQPCVLYFCQQTPFKRNQKWCHTDAPRRKNILLFPGQGSQFVGMTKQLASNSTVKKLFETANEVLGYDLLDKCLNGPPGELDKTVYCQPAVLAASLAAVEKFKETFPESEWSVSNMVAAGFSVGEYASLVLSGALTVEDAFKLIDARARAMQKASEETPSGMVTVIGLDTDEINQLVESVKDYLQEKYPNKILTIANNLYTRGFVLAGHEEAIEYVLKFGVDKHGAKRTTRLAVSGAFHTSIMKSAQTTFGKALQSVNIKTPKIKVYSNVTGKPYESSDEIQRLLPRQLVEPVQWYDTMLDICSTTSEFEQSFFELGPGRQLTSILSKINRKLVKRCKNIEV